MKIKDIVQLESHNKEGSRIWLVQDGIFYRAYEYSAMRFYEKIAPFKISFRHYKNEGVTLCYLGFPSRNMASILQKTNYDLSVYVTVSQELAFLDGFTSEMDFIVWKENKMSEVDLEAQEVNETLMHPERKPKKMSALQLFKASYDLMVRLHQFVMLISKEHKYTIGERICHSSIEMTMEAYRWAHENRGKSVSDSSSHSAIIRSSIDTIRIMLRLLIDLKKMSMKSFVSLNQQIEDIYLEVIE